MDIEATREGNNIVKIGLIPRRRGLREALETSIDKWTVIVALCRAGFNVHDNGPNSCALCAKFYKRDCRDCPVRARTGKIQCGGSPYDEWECQQIGAVSAALKELAFLKSLRVRVKP